MRKLLALALAGTMAFSLTACSSGSSAATTAAQTEAAKTEETQAETEAAEPEADFSFDSAVQITIPFKAGSNTDNQIRFIQQYLEKAIGSSVVIVNEDGASGTIGVTSYLGKDKGGSEVLFTLPTPLFKAIAGDTEYKVEDLEPIAQLTSSPFYLAVKADNADFQDGESVIEYIKANPGEFTYANAGNGGIAQLSFGSFINGAGFDALSIPYTGGTADCYTAVMGGEVMGWCVSETDLVGRDDIKAVINLGTKSSTEGFTDIPTLSELGYDGYVTDTFAGFYYMNDVADGAAEALGTAIEAMVNDADFQKACEEGNFKVSYLGEEDFTAKVNATVDAVSPILAK